MTNLWLKRILLDAFVFAFLLCTFILFIFEPSEKSLMDLRQNTLISFAAFLVGAAASEVLYRFGIKTLGELTFQSHRLYVTGFEKKWRMNIGPWQLLVFVLVSLVMGWNLTQISLPKLLEAESFYPTMKLFSSILHPNWDLLPRAVLMMVDTLFLALIATTLAIPVAFVLCFFAAKNLMTHPLAFLFYLLFRTVLNLMRSIEAFVWAIVFTVWVGIGPFAGMLALLVHSIASLTKQYSELVETAHEGPIEAIQSTGANWIQTVWYGIVPQVILPFISFTIYRWDINIRMATIVGFVGGGGIGFLLQTYTSQAMWPEVGAIISVIALVVWLMDAASAHLREALK